MVYFRFQIFSPRNGLTFCIEDEWSVEKLFQIPRVGIIRKRGTKMSTLFSKKVLLFVLCYFFKKILTTQLSNQTNLMNFTTNIIGFFQSYIGLGFRFQALGFRRYVDSDCAGDEEGGHGGELVDGMELEDGGGHDGERRLLRAVRRGPGGHLRQGVQPRPQVRRPHRPAHPKRRRPRLPQVRISLPAAHSLYNFMPRIYFYKYNFSNFIIRLVRDQKNSAYTRLQIAD